MADAAAAAAEEPNPIDGMLLAVSAYGRTDDVRALLQSGAVTNVNAQVPPTNETSLQMAASRGYKEIVRLLLDADADTEILDFQGHTALMRAAGCSVVGAPDDHRAVVQMLIQKGAVVNSATANGETPLHMACEMGRKKLLIVRELCRAGADCLAQAQTHAGAVTPLDLAVRSNEDQGVIDFLLQHCSTVIFQRHGNLCLHAILREIQIVRSAENNDNDNANNNNNNNEPVRYRLSIGSTLRIEHLLAFLDHLIALDAGMLSALNAENKIPIQVAIARRFPEQITFLLVRHYPDSLVHLS